MPNTAISIGKSMTCIAANATAKNHVPLAEKIFNQLNEDNFGGSGYKVSNNVNRLSKFVEILTNKYKELN